MTIEEFIRTWSPGWKIEMPGVDLIMTEPVSSGAPGLWVILERDGCTARRRIDPRDLLPHDGYKILMTEIRKAYEDLQIAEG